jgi:hypothetical protein
MDLPTPRGNQTASDFVVGGTPTTNGTLPYNQISVALISLANRRRSIAYARTAEVRRTLFSGTRYEKPAQCFATPLDRQTAGRNRLHIPVAYWCPHSGIDPDFVASRVPLGVAGIASRWSDLQRGDHLKK